MATVEYKPESLQQARWYEYLVRFVFGGLVTVMAGVVAKEYGPAVGGLFLAFPSIFPASVTLVHSHKKRRELGKGKTDEVSDEKGTRAAWKTAEGAAMGSIGQFCFGLAIWLLPQFLTPWLVLFLALIAWVTGALLAYFIRDWFLRREKTEKEDDYEEPERRSSLKAGKKNYKKSTLQRSGHQPSQKVPAKEDIHKQRG